MPYEKGPSDPNTSEQMGFVQCTPGILLRVTFVCLQNSRGSLSRTTFFEVDRTLSSHGFREPSSTFFDQLQRAASESASRFLLFFTVGEISGGLRSLGSIYVSTI